VEVTLRGDVTREQGYFLNFHAFGNILKSELLPLLDHKNLTKEIPFFKDYPATCENIACFIWEHLKDAFPRCTLHRVMVKETENNWAEYFGEQGMPGIPADPPGSAD
jgi:6-pyruvoyl-tetrahydropterin synthase